MKYRKQNNYFYFDLHLDCTVYVTAEVFDTTYLNVIFIFKNWCEHRTTQLLTTVIASETMKSVTDWREWGRKLDRERKVGKNLKRKNVQNKRIRTVHRIKSVRLLILNLPDCRRSLQALKIYKNRRGLPLVLFKAIKSELR